MQAMKHSRSRDSSVETARGTAVSEGEKRIARGNNTTFWAIRLSVLCLTRCFCLFFSFFFPFIFWLQLVLFSFGSARGPSGAVSSIFSTRFGFGSVQISLTRFNSVWFDSNQFGSVQFCLVRFKPV